MYARAILSSKKCSEKYGKIEESSNGEIHDNSSRGIDHNAGITGGKDVTD